MTDFLLQYAVGNVLLSLPLALAAYAVHRSGRLPAVSHLLWVLVLVKLITPPFVTLPVVPIPSVGSVTVASTPMPEPEAPPPAGRAPASAAGASITADQKRLHPEPIASTSASWTTTGRVGVVAMWLLGGVFVLVRSLTPVIRFNRLLHGAGRQPATDVQQLVSETAARLGLRSPPAISTVAAQISPLVWWIGGRPRIVIPQTIANQMDRNELRLILAHELAHIKRRDYLVRWLEWLACVCFWWNPLVWWARRNLRLNEEICSDAMVLRTLKTDPRGYASSLLNVVEFLASPAIRPPAVACAMSRGGSLERRLAMIISRKIEAKTPRWLAVGVMALALGLIPLGVAYGQDFDAVGKRLRAAVAEGEITASQAEAMMRALRATAARERASDRIREIEGAARAERISREEAARMLDEVRRAMEEAEPDRRHGGDPREVLADHIREVEGEPAHLSREEAARLIEETRRAMQETARGQDPGEPLEAFVHRIREIEAAVLAGRISPEKAARAIEETRRAVEQAARGRDPVDPGEPFRQRITEIEAAVKSGHISREEGARALEQAHRALELATRAQDPTDPRTPFLHRIRLIEAAVDAGHYTPEEGARFIDQTRQAMEEAIRAGEQREPHEPFVRRIREIDEAAKAGHISREEAVRAIDEVRRAMEEAADSRDRRDPRAFIHRIREIEAAVDAGHISREEGARLIDETRLAIEELEAEADARGDRELDARRQRYEEIEARIKRAVESGDMSREEAERALAEVRRELFDRN